MKIKPTRGVFLETFSILLAVISITASSVRAAPPAGNDAALKQRVAELQGKIKQLEAELPKWTIPEFRHPSASSESCAECHQAPPSHYTMHFNMISKKVAHQEDSEVAGCCGPTQVNQCYRCHQTTSWNDIKGVGYYKHH